MSITITKDVLEGYLKCKFKGHLKSIGEEGNPTDFELLAHDTKERVRTLAIDRFLAEHSEGDVLRGLSVTPELLRHGTSVILDATVAFDGMCICFDALVKIKERSSARSFCYAPVLFHESSKSGREQRVLLELLGMILASVQRQEPSWGILIHGADCQTRRIKLGRNADIARRKLKEISERLTVGTPPKLTLNTHCQICEFKQRCQAEASEKDDISLLRSISENEIAKYRSRGIFSVTQLSCTFRPKKKYTNPNHESPPHQHALQALAIREKKIHVLGTAEFPMPSVRLYFDIEGDPERRFDYLLGIVIESNGNLERRSFWSDDPTSERRLFEQFLEVIGRFDDYRIYCYGSYEATFLRRWIKELNRHDLNDSLIPRIVNVLSTIHSHIYFPTYSNGLKDIGALLGFAWTEANASGIQSIVWRRRWEESRSVSFKDMLINYNLEDCMALKKVTEFLFSICSGPTGQRCTQSAGHEIAQVEATSVQSSRREWCQASFAIPSFEFVNDRAYFDYQRDRVFIRSSKRLKIIQKRDRLVYRKKNLPANKRIEITSLNCPDCDGTKLTRKPDGRLVRLAYNLRMTPSGIRRVLIRFTTTRHYCRRCKRRFLPGEYLRIKEHFHALKSWAMFEYVAHRTSLANIAENVRELFGVPVTTTEICKFKSDLSRYYEGTVAGILKSLLTGPLLHSDETEVHVKGIGKGYVWVFTNLESVVYLYRPNREGEFLHTLLRDFMGVLVSDFYTAYDSLECSQQKCLIHLIRDFNQDIVKNPWDEELKHISSVFGTLLKTVVATIDRYGLKKRHLGKHRRDVDQFYQSVTPAPFRSDVAEGYRTRLVRYRAKLFTFLSHDGVPWNNNNAEHAVKAFAYYRELADNMMTSTGLNEYLNLLSVYQTCKYKGVSFLRFMISGQTDIDKFCSGHRMSVLPPIEVYAEDELATVMLRRGRKRRSVTRSRSEVAENAASTANR